MTDGKICLECGAKFDDLNPESVESGRCEACYEVKIERDGMNERIKELESQRDAAISELGKTARELGLAQARIEKLEGLLRDANEIIKYESTHGFIIAGTDCHRCVQVEEQICVGSPCDTKKMLQDNMAALEGKEGV